MALQLNLSYLTSPQQVPPRPPHPGTTVYFCLIMPNILHLVALATWLASLGHSQCANPCGYFGQLCCPSDEICTTGSNNQASCIAATSSSPTSCSNLCGIWQTITETQIEIRKKMVVYSTFIPTGCAYPPPDQTVTVTMTTATHPSTS